MNQLAEFSLSPFKNSISWGARYLSDQIATSRPEQVRLILIEAAMRRLDIAKEQASANRWDEAAESLIKAQDIVLELGASVSGDNLPLIGQIRALYAFIYHSLTKACIHRDLTQLADALRILQIEHTTWRQVCAA